MGPLRPMGDASGFHDVAEEAEVGEVELHRRSFVFREGR
jgi:hypothetical protein